MLEGARDVYGVEVHLAFDPAHVQVQDGDLVRPGVQIAPGQAYQTDQSFVALNQVDNAQGRIDYAATLVGHADGLSGRIVLARLTLAVLQEGSTGLEFAKVLLANPRAQVVPVSAEGIVLDLTP